MSEDTPLDEQVATLVKEVAELKEWRKIREGRDVRRGVEDARKEQRVIDLELALRAKENGRRDYDLLSVKLMREVMKRERCMDYKDVGSFFHFGSYTEAYRLMDRTEVNYPDYVQIKNRERGKTTRKVICKE